MPNPTTNADNLPPIPLTEEQRYLFDTRGWLLIPASSANQRFKRCARSATNSNRNQDPFPNTIAIPSAVPWRV